MCQIIKEVDTHRLLGIEVDHNLSWTPHITKLCKKLSQQVYQLFKIKNFLNEHTRKIFLHSYILSSINYGSTIFDSASANSLKPLISVYKRAVKAVILKSSSLQFKDYAKAGVLPLTDMLEENKLMFMHKIIKREIPQGLQTNFSKTPRDANKLQIPIPRIDLYKSSLRYSGSTLWNSLPQNLKTIDSSVTFKKHVLLLYAHKHNTSTEASAF